MSESTRTRWSFYDKRQTYLFMVWQEDWYAGEVIYARVLFKFLNLFALREAHANYLKWADAPHRFGGHDNA